jgi:hypothetical protein
MLRTVSWRFVLVLAALAGAVRPGLAVPLPGPDEGAPKPVPGGQAPPGGDPGSKVPGSPVDPPPASSLSPEDARTAKAQLDDSIALQARRQFASARRKLLDWLERWPGADAELRREADERSAENAFLGIEQVHVGGPSANRIDVELMGDGYLLTQQDVFRKHAEAQLVEFWAEPLTTSTRAYSTSGASTSRRRRRASIEVAAGGATDRQAAEEEAQQALRKVLGPRSTARAAGPQNRSGPIPRWSSSGGSTWRRATG